MLHLSFSNQAVERGEAECPICLTELWLPTNCSRSELTTPSFTINIPSSTKKPSQKKQNNCKTMGTLINKTTGRPTILPQTRKNSGLKDREPCLIDEMNGNSCNSASKSDNKEQTRCLRSTVLLSCTHVFHSTCLRTLEDIAMQDMKNTCPVCRAHYQKKILDF